MVNKKNRWARVCILVVGAGVCVFIISMGALLFVIFSRPGTSSKGYADPTLGVFDPVNRKQNLHSSDITDRRLAMVTYRYMAASLTTTDFLDLVEFLKTVEMPEAEGDGTMVGIFFVGRDVSEQVLAHEVWKVAREQHSVRYPQQLLRIGMKVLPRIDPLYSSAIHQGDDSIINIDIEKLEDIMHARHLLWTE